MRANNRKTYFLILGLILFSFVTVFEPLLSSAFAISLVIIILFMDYPVYGIILFIIMIPFSETIPVTYTIAGIQGLKLFNLLSIITAAAFIFSGRIPRRLAVEDIFILGAMALFIVSVFRSLIYVEGIFFEMWSAQYSTTNYLQCFLLKPVFLFMPFMLIVKYIYIKEDINRIIYGIYVSIFILSVFLVIIYIFIVNDKTDFENVRGTFASFIHIHGNELANYYITVFPLLLAPVKAPAL